MVLDGRGDPFTIPGEDGIDLVARWIVDPATDALIGLHARHVDPENWPECRGGGYIAWVQVPGITPAARHQIVSGGPDGAASLTISPSLWHRDRHDGNSPHRGCHGFIRNGRWVPV